MSYGPEIPKHLLKKTEERESDDEVKEEEKGEENDVQEEEQENDDSYGPALPPHLLAKRKEEEEEATRKRKIGPYIPSKDEYEQSNQGYPEEEEDDEIFGPRPSQIQTQNDDDGVEERIAAFYERAEKMRKKLTNEETEEPQKLTRGEWMLQPPEWEISKADPLKSRTFLQREITADMKDNSAWTKNPLEKAKPKETKIDDNVAKKRKVEEVSKVIQDYNSQNRPKSLMEEYQEKYMHERVQKDVEGRKTFDRERDLTFRRIAPDKKKQMLEHASKMNTQFSGGGFL